jgi:hypothetical protein
VWGAYQSIGGWQGKEVARIEDAECKTIDSVAKFIQ